MFIGIVLLLILVAFIGKLSFELPDYRQLADYEPAVTTRLFAGDGQLLMEYVL